MQNKNETSLIMENDEEEDRHFCMKCKTVIQGLSVYIDHRKQKCFTVSTAQVKSLLLS